MRQAVVEMSQQRRTEAPEAEGGKKESKSDGEHKHWSRLGHRLDQQGSTTKLAANRGRAGAFMETLTKLMDAGVQD